MTKFFARKESFIPIPPDPPIIPNPLEPFGIEGWARFYNGGTGVIGGGEETMTEYSDFDALWEALRTDGSTTYKNYLYTGPDVVLSNYTTAGYPEYRSNGRSNKGIYGLGQELKGGTLRFDYGENVIIQNFRITESPNDLLRILGTVGMVINFMDLDGGAYFDEELGIWVYPTGDGNLDITTEADLITFMNSKIRRGDKAHLVSASSEAYSDRGKLRITTNGCLFENNLQRQPNVRFSQYDLVNSFQTSPLRALFQKCIQPGRECKVNVRGVWFEDLNQVVGLNNGTVPGEIWFGEHTRVNIDNADTSNVTQSPTRLWTYPDLNGQPYDVPILNSADAKAYCLSSNVGCQIVV